MTDAELIASMMLRIERLERIVAEAFPGRPAMAPPPPERALEHWEVMQVRAVYAALRAVGEKVLYCYRLLAEDRDVSVGTIRNALEGRGAYAEYGPVADVLPDLMPVRHD